MLSFFLFSPTCYRLTDAVVDNDDDSDTVIRVGGISRRDDDDNASLPRVLTSPC